MDLQLDGKVALVTGSSRGIGEAVAKGLAREGATIIVHGRDPQQTQRVVRDVAAEGGQAHGVTADLTVDEEVHGMLERACAAAGHVDIIVNNAGGSGSAKDWGDTSSAAWAASYDRNVLTAVRVTTPLLSAMRAAKWGRVINISSLAGLMPPASRPDYSAAKAAMAAMTASMAKAVAADGVTVNTVSPGTIHSDKLEAKFRQVATEQHGFPKGAPWSEIEKAVLPLFAHVPLGRVGQLGEIADAICFLASPRAAYITGSNIRLDGGMLPTM